MVLHNLLKSTSITVYEPPVVLQNERDLNSTLDVSEGIGEASQIESSTEKNKRGVEGGGGGGAAKLGEEKEAAGAEDEKRRVEEAAATTSRDNQSGAEWGKTQGAAAKRNIGCEIFIFILILYFEYYLMSFHMITPM